jgi:hypothetical protein
VTLKWIWNFTNYKSFWIEKAIKKWLSSTQLHSMQRLRPALFDPLSTKTSARPSSDHFSPEGKSRCKRQLAMTMSRVIDHDYNVLGVLQSVQNAP